jgi:hypothetical protein
LLAMDARGLGEDLLAGAERKGRCVCLKETRRALSLRAIERIRKHPLLLVL